MKGLTDRQNEIFDFIRNFRRIHGYSPSYREIQEFFDFRSIESVMGHLKSLKAKGKVTWVPGSARTLREI